MKQTELFNDRCPVCGAILEGPGVREGMYCSTPCLQLDMAQDGHAEMQISRPFLRAWEFTLGAEIEDQVDPIPEIQQHLARGVFGYPTEIEALSSDEIRVTLSVPHWSLPYAPKEVTGVVKFDGNLDLWDQIDFVTNLGERAWERD